MERGGISDSELSVCTTVPNSYLLGLQSCVYGYLLFASAKAFMPSLHRLGSWTIPAGAVDVLNSSKLSSLLLEVASGSDTPITVSFVEVFQGMKSFGLLFSMSTLTTSVYIWLH